MMAVDHKRARELQDTSLRALMEAPPPNTAVLRHGSLRSRDLMASVAADWIDAVRVAWERQER